MPTLKPTFSQDLTREILAEVLPPAQNNLPETKKGRARTAFDQNGLTLDKVARKMSDMLDYAEEESSKLKVMDMALKVHGAMDDDKAESKQVVINISFANCTNVEAINQVLIPRT